MPKMKVLTVDIQRKGGYYGDDLYWHRPFRSYAAVKLQEMVKVLSLSDVTVDDTAGRE